MNITKFTLLLGIVFIAIGVWGILTGGHNHNLLIFGVNMSHNLVHLASGALALLASFKGFRTSQIFCLAFGAVYGLVTLLGFVNYVPVVSMLNLNQADNFLHLGITAGCLFFWATSKKAV